MNHITLTRLHLNNSLACTYITNRVDNRWDLRGKGGVQGHFWDFKICFASTFLLTFTFYRTKLSRSTQKLWCFCWVTYDKIYSNFHTFWKEANFQLRFWEKKFRGLNICAKTLLFGILTLDRLFLKRYAAIFLILIFLPDMACESCLNWQKMAKIVIFQLWRSKNRVTNQLIKNSRITFLKNHMEMLHAKFQTISTNIVASKFFFVEFF